MQISGAGTYMWLGPSTVLKRGGNNQVRMLICACLKVYLLECEGGGESGGFGRGGVGSGAVGRRGVSCGSTTSSSICASPKYVNVCGIIPEAGQKVVFTKAKLQNNC